VDRESFKILTDITEAQLISLLKTGFIVPEKDPVNGRGDFSEPQIIRARKAVANKEEHPDWSWDEAMSEANKEINREKFSGYNKK
jgi:hypothetical protein